MFTKFIKHSTLLLAVIASLALVSCEGDQGPTGPQGPAGAKGDAGPTGATGAQGDPALKKTGSISGTIKGTRQDGVAFNESFNYEYAEEPIEGFDGQNTSFWLERYSEPNYNSAYAEIRLRVQDKGLQTENIYADYLYFYFYKELSVNKAFTFSLGSNKIQISNYKYDASTGKLTFDFTYVGTDNSSGNEATITGSFTTGSGKFYKDVVSRKSS
jgi:hypothetical protein